MQVADFGCGSGHWVIPLAKQIGSQGKIYAVDIQKEALEAVRSQAKLEHIDSIETIWADLELPGATKLKDGIIDLIIIANILFQAENKTNVLQEALRILKPSGRLMLVEWDMSQTIAGPSMANRIPRQEVETLLAKVGFIFEKEFSAGSQHYGLLFRKP